MKKLMIAAAVMACAIAANAASMIWSYGTTVAENGYTVYAILGSSASTDWHNETEVANAAMSEATVAKVGMTYAASETAQSSSLTTASSLYYVLVDADSEQFAVTSVYTPGSTYVYDESSESQKDAFIVSGFGSMQDWKTDPTPEPTSGLLLLIGMSALALRRRRA